jgi:hypothetical protein
MLSILFVTGEQKITTCRAIHVLYLRIIVRKETKSPYTHIRRNIILFVSNNITFNKHIQFPFLFICSLNDLVKQIRDYLVTNLIWQLHFSYHEHLLYSRLHFFILHNRIGGQCSILFFCTEFIFLFRFFHYFQNETRSSWFSAILPRLPILYSERKYIVYACYQTSSQSAQPFLH